jgi:integrase
MALAEFIVDLDRGNVLDSTSTFKEFTGRWWTEYATKKLAPKTQARYKEILDTRVLPAMGHLKIGDIRPMHIIDFLSNIREDGIRLDKKDGCLSEGSVLYHYRMISSILGKAKRWQVILNNPAANVEPPKVEKKKAKCYDEEQMGILLDALEQLLPTKKLKYRAMVELALATGERRGEIMGLEWTDFDLDKCTVNIHQTIQYLPEKGTFVKGTKNESSERLIAVPASTIAVLKSWKAAQNEQRLKAGELWHSKNEKGEDVSWVFTTQLGKPMHPDTISSWFPEFVSKIIVHTTCGGFIQKEDYCPHCEKQVPPDEIYRLPRLNFHGTRHTSATLLIAEGADIREVAGRLGHANTSTTGKVYLHFLKKADQAAAEKMDDLMTRRKNKTATKRQPVTPYNK